MTRDDWFKEEPSQAHRDKVMQAAALEFEKQAAVQSDLVRVQSRRRWTFGTLATASMALAAFFIQRVVKNPSHQEPSAADGTEWALQGLELDEVDLSEVQTTELATEIEVLENLEFLEVLDLLEKQESEKWEV